MNQPKLIDNTIKYIVCIIVFCSVGWSACVADDAQSVTLTDFDVIAKSPLKYKEEWPSIAKHRIPEWFRDAKFGIYACIGPVSVATQYHTTEWYGWAMYLEHSRTWTYTPNNKIGREFKLHKEKWGDQNEFGYKDFLKLFKPDKFNAEEWAEIFQKSGAKFSGPIAVHHDNYLMWDSKVSRWNSKHFTGIDFCGELEKSVKKRGMKYVMTFHHAYTWWYYVPSYDFDGDKPGNEDLYCRPHKFNSDPDSFEEYPDAEFEDIWYKKLDEACVKYSPDLIWFDMGLELLSDNIRKKAFARLLNLADSRKQEIGICYKIKYDVCIPPSAGILDYEKGRSLTIRELPWLTDTSLGGWFYNGRPSRSPKAVIEILVDIVSKNGCLLLDVSPKPDGSIPDDQKATLLDIGRWMKINGEAIYNTRPWNIAEEGPTRLKVDGHFNENWESIYTNKDIRFTRSKNGKILYAIVLGKPDSKVVIKSLSPFYQYLDKDISKVELLGNGEKGLDWKLDNNGLHIDVPNDSKGEYAWSFKISLK